MFVNKRLASLRFGVDEKRRKGEVFGERDMMRSDEEMGRRRQ